MRGGTANLIDERFIWRKTYSDIKHWTQSGINTRKLRSSVTLRLPLDIFLHPMTASRTFMLSGRFNIRNEGYQYLLIIIDRFTRWTTMVALKTTPAEVVSREILRDWIPIFG